MHHYVPLFSYIHVYIYIYVWIHVGICLSGVLSARASAKLANLSCTHSPSKKKSFFALVAVFGAAGGSAACADFLETHSFFRSDRRYCVFFFPMATCPNPGMEKTCSDFCSNRRYSYSCMMFLIYRLSKPVPHIGVDVILVTKKGVLSINIVKVPKEKRRHTNKHGLLSLCRWKRWCVSLQSHDRKTNVFSQFQFR